MLKTVFLLGALLCVCVRAALTGMTQVDEIRRTASFATCCVGPEFAGPPSAAPRAHGLSTLSPPTGAWARPRRVPQPNRHLRRAHDSSLQARALRLVWSVEPDRTWSPARIGIGPVEGLPWVELGRSSAMAFSAAVGRGNPP